MKKQYYLLDIVKFICCFFVVALHTGFLSEFDSVTGFWIEKSLLRLAVPFYFISSGFLLGKKLNGATDINEVKAILVGYSKRLVIMLVVFEPISILLNGWVELSQGKSFVYIVLSAARYVIFYPKGALWFVQACLVAVWIWYFFRKYNLNRFILPVAGFLYGFALLCNSYYFLVENTIIGSGVNLLIRITASPRNGVFVGFLMIYLGMCVSKYEKQNRLSKAGLGAAVGISYVLYLVEVYLLSGRATMDDGSLYILLPVFSMLLCLFCAQFTSEKTNTKQLRNLSTGIYLLHSPLSYIRYLGIYWFSYDMRGIVGFLLVTTVSVVICLLSYRSKNKTMANLLK